MYLFNGMAILLSCLYYFFKTLNEVFCIIIVIQMSKSTALIIFIVFLILTRPFYFNGILVLFTSYDVLVRQKNRVDMSGSGIDLVLKKRYDFIPNLVASVKEYKNYEKSSLKVLLC